MYYNKRNINVYSEIHLMNLNKISIISLRNHENLQFIS